MGTYDKALAKSLTARTEGYDINSQENMESAFSESTMGFDSVQRRKGAAKQKQTELKKATAQPGEKQDDLRKSIQESESLKKRPEGTFKITDLKDVPTPEKLEKSITANRLYRRLLGLTSYSSDQLKKGGSAETFAKLQTENRLMAELINNRAKPKK